MSKKDNVIELVNVSTWRVLCKVGFYVFVAPTVLGICLHGFANGIFRVEEYIGHQLGQAADAVAQAAGYQIPDALERAQTLDDVIDIEATQHDLHPDLLRAVIKQESVGNQWAVSHKGAMGLMQLMPKTVQHCIKKGILKDTGAAYDDKQNIKCGAYWLRNSFNETGNSSLADALRNYNGGPDCFKSRACKESEKYQAIVSKNFYTRNIDIKSKGNS